MDNETMLERINKAIKGDGYVFKDSYNSQKIIETFLKVKRIAMAQQYTANLFEIDDEFSIKTRNCFLSKTEILDHVCSFFKCYPKIEQNNKDEKVFYGIEKNLLVSNKMISYLNKRTILLLKTQDFSSTSTKVQEENYRFNLALSIMEKLKVEGGS
jgi:hypothetical protein